jgi:hypothetical protein
VGKPPPGAAAGARARAASGRGRPDLHARRPANGLDGLRVRPAREHDAEQVADLVERDDLVLEGDLSGERQGHARLDLALAQVDLGDAVAGRNRAVEGLFLGRLRGRKQAAEVRVALAAHRDLLADELLGERPFGKEEPPEVGVDLPHRRGDLPG